MDFMELIWELQMDVKYSCLQRELLSTLVLAATWAVETYSLQKTWLQAYKMALQTALIITQLETLWNFIRVRWLKPRMSTSEIHLKSLHVSKLNSEMNL